jgi:hypothetical protein
MHHNIKRSQIEILNTDPIQSFTQFQMFHSSASNKYSIIPPKDKTIDLPSKIPHISALRKLLKDTHIFPMKQYMMYVYPGAFHEEHAYK